MAERKDSKYADDDDDLDEARDPNPDELGRGGGKMNKAQADYGMGQPFRRCGVCEHYRANRCKIVEGKIDPLGLCEYWSCADEGGRAERREDEQEAV